MTTRSALLPSADSRLPLPAYRRGFTIIELAVVVLIIGILVALLFPAISGAMRTARDAQVVTEMSALDKAIVDFKSRFGIEPPSFMVLYEEGDDWAVGNPAGVVSDEQHRASRAIIRQMWPEFDFTYGGGGNIDLNDNGTDDEVLILNGAECLVFFLGCGTEQVDTDGDGTDDAWATLGFAANPQDPFSTGGNTVGPFHEFSSDRFVDIDGDEMPEYVDPLPEQTAPYIYVSSYDGRGYQPFGLDYDCAVPSNPTTTDDELPSSTLTDIYYLSWTDECTNKPLNPNTFQIISPGEDGEYGTGGLYNGESVGSAAGRAYERDNITNFKGGRLN